MTSRSFFHQLPRLEEACSPNHLVLWRSNNNATNTLVKKKKGGGGVQQFSYHVTKIGKWYKVRVISSAQNTPANVCVNMLTKTTYQVEMAIFTCTSTQYQKHWMAHRLSFSEPHWADVNQCFMWTEVALKGTIRTTQNFTRFKNLPGQNSPCANSNKKFNQISYLSKETTMAPRLLL